MMMEFLCNIICKPKQSDIKGKWKLWSIKIHDNVKNRKSYTRENTIGMDMIIDAARAEWRIYVSEKCKNML